MDSLVVQLLISCWNHTCVVTNPVAALSLRSLPPCFVVGCDCWAHVCQTNGSFEQARCETFSLRWLCSLSSVLLINAVRFEPSIKSTQDKWIRKWSSWIQRAQRGSLPSSWMTHFNDCNLILMAVIQRGGFETCWSFAQRRIAGFLKSGGRIAVRYDTNLLKKALN